MSRHEKIEPEPSPPIPIRSGKSRSYSEDVVGYDYSILPEIRVDTERGQEESSQGKERRASYGDISDGCVPSKLPRSRSYDSVLFEFREVAAEDFANQLTLIDVKLFKAITEAELVECSWEGKDKVAKAPNVVQFSRRFNNVTFWTQREVLGAESVKIRVSVLRHFIKIAKKLLDLNNLHSMMAVVLALQSAPIHRLIQTWRQVPNKDKRSLQKLERLVSVTNNRQTLRDHLSSVSLPCIPYFGLYLQDLTYANTMNKRSPCAASNRKANILKTINYFQSSEYRRIDLLVHIQKYLLSIEYMEEMQKFVDDDNFKLSLSLEPDGSSPYKEYPGSGKLPRRLMNGGGSSSSLRHVLEPERSSTLPLDFRRKQDVSLFHDGFLSPRGMPKRRGNTSGAGPPLLNEMGKKPFKGKHKKSHSLGRILDIEFPIERMSCLESLESHSDLHTPLASAEELSSSDIDTISIPSPQHSLSTIASNDKDSDDTSVLSLEPHRHEEALHEGYLKRKTLRKEAKRVYGLHWTRCWGIVESGYILLYSSKGTSRRPERSAFKAKPRYCLQLDGCTVAASTSDQKPIFTLTDEKGTVRKFYTYSAEDMEKWVTAIQTGITSHMKGPELLISL
eukprot:m.113269 g.113269  ORF g.113269 m.113269 type:complete len:619 (+) comp37458_c0_seq1:131-1987(+)